MKSARSRGNVFLFTLGVLLTLVVLGSSAAGRLDWLEFYLLDERFRSPLINPVRPDPRITCINISDQALQLVGRWPWSRTDQGGLLGMLAELGAGAVLVDITYVEPELAGVFLSEDASLSPNEPDVAGALPAIGYPDRELEYALRAAGNVFLAYHHPPSDLERSAVFELAVSAFARGEDAEAGRLLANADAEWSRSRRDGNRDALLLPSPSLRAHLTALLEANPHWSDAELARATAAGGEATRGFPRALETATRRLARGWLAANTDLAQRDPHAAWLALHKHVVGSDVPGQSGLTRALRIGFVEALGYAATVASGAIPAERLRAAAPEVDGFAPVYFLHARAARGCGFANFVPDSDGAVRRLQLFARHGPHGLVQLAVAVGRYLLDLTPERIETTPRAVLLRGADPRGADQRIPLDEGGFAHVPWIPAFGGHHFREVDARDLWLVWDRRRQMHNNTELVLGALEYLLQQDDFIDFLDEREALRAARRAAQERLAALRKGEAAGVRAAEQLRGQSCAQLRRAWPAIRAKLDALSPVASIPASAPVASRPTTPLAQARELIEFAESASAKLQADNDADISRLAALVSGKVCLLGYTATSLADAVKTPVSPRAPGVLAHANLINGLLTGRWVHPAPAWLNAGLTLACGLLATVAGVHLRGRAAGLTIPICLGALLLGAGWAPFRFGLWWVWLAPPLVALLLPFVVLIVLRYIFVDRERRELATALGQYTSRQIARLVSENADLCRRAEMREVTAMFTDLRGFTSISERIGAQRTQQVLNTLLGRSTDVVLKHEGMLNKFMGDGVFAFWNPVIYPQQDHARRACAAALDLVAALQTLQRQPPTAGENIFAELAMRIGIATGNSIVGPCGSEQKFDYTCIGDSVNLAARLESANRFYGTSMLVSAATQAQSGGSFAFRPLGAVRVKGKREAVLIYELLGHRDAISAEQQAYAEYFGNAVELFRARRWEDARTAFGLCVRMRESDPAAAVYIEAVQRFLREPPPEDWNTALELLEK